MAAFAFGRARGVIEGVCDALSLPIAFLTSPIWKRHADIPPGAENKDLARTRAIARWPAQAELFKRKCDVDRAEACLVGGARSHAEVGPMTADAAPLAAQAPLAEAKAVQVELLRDFVFEMLWPIECDAGAGRLCLANDDDVGARYHLKRVVECVKAAAKTFRELEDLKRDGRSE